MSDTSPKFALPYILPGQAQKEVLHNEALAAIDALLHACVESAVLTDPPDEPVPGQSWIVAPGSVGVWSGHDGSLATWTGGGWRFVPPQSGLSAWNRDTARHAFYSDSGWVDGVVSAASLAIDGVQVVGARQPTIASPSGGTTIDAEARASIGAVIAALMSHGLID